MLTYCVRYILQIILYALLHQKHYKRIVYGYGFNAFSNRHIPQVKCTACCFIKFLFIVQRPTGFQLLFLLSSLFSSSFHLLFRLFEHRYKLPWSRNRRHSFRSWQNFQKLLFHVPVILMRAWQIEFLEFLLFQKNFSYLLKNTAFTSYIFRNRQH